MLNCQEFREKLDAWLDHELEPGQAEALQRHAEECGACASEVDGARRLQSWLRDPDLFAMPDGVSARLHHALEQRMTEAVHSRIDSPPAPAPHAARPSFWARVLGSPASGRWWSYRPAWAAVAIAILLAVGVARWNAAGASTVSGWLIDGHCYVTYRNNAQNHPRSCLLKCASKGYGLINARGQFLRFNAKGNRSALAAIRSTHKLNHFWVTVLATQTSDHVLDVEHLALTTPPQSPPTAQ